MSFNHNQSEISIKNIQSYIGYLLVAHPHNPRDDLFKSVIVVLKETQKMVIGLQINYVLSNLDINDIIRSAGIENSTPLTNDINLYCGGNKNMHKVYILHSSDWTSSSSMIISDELALTQDLSVLAAIVQGHGPRRYRACVGHCVWDNFDQEIKNQNSRKWEILPANIDNVFNVDHETQWSQCLDQALQFNYSQWIK
jgi:putative transcriptional regulator